MIGKLPDFILKSEFVVPEINNIHLKKDAPKELVEQMKEFRKKFYNDENVYGDKDYNNNK